MRKLKLTFILVFTLILSACGMSDSSKEETLSYMQEYEQFLTEVNSFVEATPILKLSWHLLDKEDALEFHYQLHEEYNNLPVNKHTKEFHKFLGLFNDSQMKLFEAMHELQYNPNDNTTSEMVEYNEQVQTYIEKMKEEQKSILGKLGLNG